MPYIDPEVIAQVRQMDLLTYLRCYEPGELVKLTGDLYSTRSHDSLKISHGKWMWWSRGIGGVSALDYLVKVREMSFMEAVECLSGRLISSYSPPSPAPKAVEKELKLPQKNGDNRRVYAYLRSRGIEKEVIRYCLNRGLLYESLPYHNAVFVGYDDDGKEKYAAYRAVNGRRIMGDCSGSDKAFCFRMIGESRDTVHLFEAAIDLLSYASLRCMKGENWRAESLLSLGGVAGASSGSQKRQVPAALQNYLNRMPQTKRIVLHLDNDEPGRLAAARIMETLKEQYVVIDDPPEKGKDVNDFLCFQKGILHREEAQKEVEDGR